ncbi:hypothetical protein HDU86_007821 [Geranomyces michiganensis]|nr:hypothetical protein HDU86_007821 [Geranomyces michiganensis]
MHSPPHLFALLAAAAAATGASAFSPIPREIQDIARLSPTLHIYVNGSGIPTLVRAAAASNSATQAFNESVAAAALRKEDDAGWWPAVADPFAPSFYGVAAALVKGEADDAAATAGDETVFLADTRFNVVQMANLRTGMRRLLYDPALLEAFANTSTTGLNGTSAGAGAAAGIRTPETSASSLSSGTALSGLIRTSREGRGDVLLVGLNNQIWRVPAPARGTTTTPGGAVVGKNNVTAIGDAIEMLAAGFGAAWTVKDLCQYDNRVVVSLVRNAMPRAATASSSSSPQGTTQFPSAAVVVRYNVYPSGLGPALLSTPRIVRRVQARGAGGGATTTPPPPPPTTNALKLDCDAQHVYIADNGWLAVHDLVTGKEITGAAKKIDVDEPTAVVVAAAAADSGGEVLVTGKCRGQWCADQIPPLVVPGGAVPLPPVAAP